MSHSLNIHFVYFLLQITNPVAVTEDTAVETAMVVMAVATVVVVAAVDTETGDLEVVTNPVATGEEPNPCLTMKKTTLLTRSITKTHTNTWLLFPALKFSFPLFRLYERFIYMNCLSVVGALARLIIFFLY